MLPAIHLINCQLASLTVDQAQDPRGYLDLTGTRASGGLRLRSAHIGGLLSFDGAKLTTCTGMTLDGDGLRVDQDMLCQKDFTAEGRCTYPGRASTAS